MQLILLPVLMLAAGCASSGPNKVSGSTVPFETLFHGTQSGIREAGFSVITSQEEYADLIERMDRDLPEVDFTARSVAAVFAGEKSTGGYSVTITGIRREPSGLVADFVLKEPSEGSMVVQVITAPGHVVSFPRADENLIFREIESGSE
ncbi:MAG: protease complex subunit PrcB family protein [Spirochaetia bacterium]